MLFAKLNDSKIGVIPENYTISELIEKGVVDKVVNQYANPSSYQVQVINCTDIDSFSSWFVK